MGTSKFTATTEAVWVPGVRGGVLLGTLTFPLRALHQHWGVSVKPELRPPSRCLKGTRRLPGSLR